MKLEAIEKGILQGNTRALAKGITLLESDLPQQVDDGSKLVDSLMKHTGKSLRIGVSGVPGVGKSTFIESFGMQLLEEGGRIAVLAIDPTSPLSKGSILGDKTRMEKLSAMDNAFIRPTPTRGSLGGVARKTRESILLCEAAGYSTILVETVGVGQSEILVHSMVDVFLMLQIPNAGDELQGVKKGILELADVIAVTKCDGGYEKEARRTKVDHIAALQLVRGHASWVPPVILTSALNGTGLDEVECKIKEFAAKQKASKEWERKRKGQVLDWFDAEIGRILATFIESKADYHELYQSAKNSVSSLEKSPTQAARELIKLLVK